MSAKRFGARYGRTLRKKVEEIEMKMRKRYGCPSCGARAVKRVSVGIWQCKRCGYKFTGRAYAPFTVVGGS